MSMSPRVSNVPHSIDIQSFSLMNTGVAWFLLVTFRYMVSGLNFHVFFPASIAMPPRTVEVFLGNVENPPKFGQELRGSPLIQSQTFKYHQLIEQCMNLIIVNSQQIAIHRPF